MADQETLLEEIALNTRAIAQLLALSVAKDDVTSRLAAVLDTDQRRSAYIASDGNRSAREVARIADTTHPTIGKWWDDWAVRGLVVGPGNGRMRAIIDLELFGLAGGLAEGLP